jgi:hypothetical protein
MACTPYPFGNDRLENPIVRVSNNGVDWCCFPGAPDPLVAEPDELAWHHADTDLIIYNDTLYVFYISTNRHTAETAFLMITTSDGLNWTSPVAIYRDTWGVSPAVVVDSVQRWSLWYVWCDTFSNQQVSVVYRRTGSDPLTLGDSQRCMLVVPNHVVWHLDVIQDGETYEALVTAFPRGTDPSRSRLFHALSSDGLTFVLSRKDPIIQPSWFGWDNRMIYRSTFIKIKNDHYRLWYTGASWGMRCGIGALEGVLTNLQPMLCTTVSGQSNMKLFFENFVGLSKYILTRILPGSAIRNLKLIQSKLIRLVQRS